VCTQGGGSREGGAGRGGSLGALRQKSTETRKHKAGGRNAARQRTQRCDAASTRDCTNVTTTTAGGKGTGYAPKVRPATPAHTASSSALSAGGAASLTAARRQSSARTSTGKFSCKPSSSWCPPTAHTHTHIQTHTGQRGMTDISPHHARVANVDAAAVPQGHLMHLQSQ
jgi:hypothetical protein